MGEDELVGPSGERMPGYVYRGTKCYYTPPLRVISTFWGILRFSHGVGWVNLWTGNAKIDVSKLAVGEYILVIRGGVPRCYYNPASGVS